MRKLVRKSYTPVVPIANTCSIGYPHDGRADNAAYRHDRRADNAAYRHNRRADSLSQKKTKMIMKNNSRTPNYRRNCNCSKVTSPFATITTIQWRSLSFFPPL